LIRKFFSVLFAGLILFNLCGFFFVFRYEQDSLKKEMKGWIRSGFFRGQYEQITVTNPSACKDLRILDKDEIIYRGKLYDVVSSAVSGNTITFLCINDTKEEGLVAHYDNFLKWTTGLNSPQKSRTGQAMVYHIIKHAFLPHITFTAPEFSFQPVKWADPCSDLNSISPKPFSPPPETI
jgi:hypothetical protein